MKKAVIIFTRVPVAGKTKTRMMPELSAVECCELHESMLKDLLTECRTLPDEYDLFVYGTPETQLMELTALTGTGGLILRPQRGDDLGSRMRNATAAVLNAGYEAAVLTGCDIPELNAGHLKAAFRQLEEYDVVISPTIDGGYYLIGMKADHEQVWDLPVYGTATVYEQTLERIRDAGLTAGCGAMLRDFDTVEDIWSLLISHGQTGAETGAFLKRYACVHCGKCTDSCLFLQKYGIDLGDFTDRPELAWHCFLCGKCSQVCPKDIDGRQIALIHRKNLVTMAGGQPDRCYRGLLREKNPYLFRTYQGGGSRAALFPGCNFTGFFPQTEKRLIRICREHDIGLVRDCCSKPVYELGLRDDARRNIRAMAGMLEQENIRELLVVCPNCYYFLKKQFRDEKIAVQITSIYEKLRELGTGQKLPADLPVYYPCPDRQGQEMMEGIRYFMEGPEQDACAEAQCCGLGGCTAAKEPELAGRMAEMGAGKMYTYCASCISQFRRNGQMETYHLLSEILGVAEKVPLGIGPFVNRALGKVRK